MKKVAGILMLTITTLATHGQTGQESIFQAKQLIETRQYESAYQALDKADPANQNPESVLLKEVILLNYSLSNKLLKDFELHDLKGNESSATLKLKKEAFTVYHFNADSILNELLKKEPDNCELYKGLGNYYYVAGLTFNGDWILPTEEINNLTLTNYKKANELHCGDYLSYYATGYAAYRKEEYAMGISLLYQSVELNGENADAQYYLGDCYYHTKEFDLALQHFKKALSLHTEAGKRSGVAETLAHAYLEMNHPDSAITYYELADKLTPGNSSNQKALLDLYLKKSNKKYITISKTILDRDPRDPANYITLDAIYFANSKKAELISFYQQQLTVSTNDVKTKGLLNFSLGKIYLDSDKKLAKEYFVKAKNLCKTQYSAQDPVMQAIENAIQKADMK